MAKIGVVIVCTNVYFVLGIRFVKNFMRHYTGKSDIHFYLFTDTDPSPYVPNLINVHYRNASHDNWVKATNSKYHSILSLKDEDLDYIYYFDADTNIGKHFDESWFLGDLVGGEHYGNRGHMLNNKPFDKNPKSKAYVPKDTELPQTYYYGAFWGGRKENVLNMCNILYNNQQEDKKIPYEPVWNDESYVNNYFHYNPPTFVVLSNKFAFGVSDKGGIENTRDTKKDTEIMKKAILERPTEYFKLTNGNVIF
jgi:hypothetical protein